MTTTRTPGGVASGGADTGAPAVPVGHFRAPRGLLVTIGLPVYNGEEYLAVAVESILAQDYSHLQLIIADNGSTDRTREICREYARSDSRVDYHRSPVNRGAAWNYNRIAQIAEGEYFKWAAHDDVCSPSFIGRCVAELDEADSSVVLAYPRTSIINTDGAVVSDYEDDLDLREQYPHERLRHFLASIFLANPVFGLIRTAELLETELIGGYAHSDIVLLMQLALRGKFHEVTERFFLRRVHAGTSVTANPRPRDLAAWFDTKRSRRSLPRTEMALHMVESVFRDRGLDETERARCLTLLGQYWTRRCVQGAGKKLRPLPRAHAPRAELPGTSDRST